MNRHAYTSLLIVGILTITGVPTTLYAQSAETDQLKATVKSLDQSVRDLQQKVADLEKRNALVSDGQSPGISGPASNDIALVGTRKLTPSPDDLTLDPQYRGFIPIPHSPAMVRFNAKPRVDFIFDTGNPGDPDRFVPAKIPVEGDPSQGGGSRFNVSAKGTRLMLDVLAPSIDGAPRFYYENDFFGSGTADLNFKINYLYMQYPIEQTMAVECQRGEAFIRSGYYR